MITYHIRLRGQLDAAELNQHCPQHMRLISTGEEATLLSARTDQSGLLGLLRALHNIGLELLSVASQPAEYMENGSDERR